MGVLGPLSVVRPGTCEQVQNTGTNTAPAFAAPVNNPFGITATYQYAFPSFTDLDNDGDYDLAVGEYYGAIQYFENTGTAMAPAFAAPVSNPFGLNASEKIMEPKLIGPTIAKMRGTTRHKQSLL